MQDDRNSIGFNGKFLGLPEMLWTVEYYPHCPKCMGEARLSQSNTADEVRLICVVCELDETCPANFKALAGEILQTAATKVKPKE